ncbi:MAG: D-hexose-6-phosphate mutarotase [Azospirillaceae bacterium]|nr:D-hexose-6-phosphate mutarotase [Azospirillaceae bacterium]
MSQYEALSRQFGHVKAVRFCQSEALYPQLTGSLPLIIVENRLAKAVLSPYGAHIISFVPAGGPDLLWLSPLTKLVEGTPIRGGIPLCLPWFGPSPQGFPQHGFARISNWQVEEITERADGATVLVLTLSDSEARRAMWPHAFTFRFEITVGTGLELTMSVKNQSQSDARFELAFHTYFNVGDVKQTTIEGLDACTYVDREDQQKRKKQVGLVAIKGTTTSLYVAVPNVQVVHSPLGDYRIDGTQDYCMVWNPGDLDKTVGDIGAGNHQGFLCAERLDAAEGAVTIHPGASYTARMILSQA